MITRKLGFLELSKWSFHKFFYNVHVLILFKKQGLRTSIFNWPS
uniref:Uncharacterized protein n=1 Tax=Rhizophora mucronata TaxID=61149 RepID=A0A2P2PJR7_RHIMU